MTFRGRVLFAAVLLWSAVSLAAQDVHAVAAKVDAHYNHLTTLRASFTEHYSGMGLQRTESGTVLLKKPGRMLWTYNSGKLFVLDGKYAVSYTPGEPQAQRLPSKQLDDMRSPLRFLLGKTRLEKELSNLQINPAPNGEVNLSGSPAYALSPGDGRVAKITLRVSPVSGQISALRMEEIDGSVTEFTLTASEENVPASDADFHFNPPPGVTVIDGLPAV